MLKVVDLFSGAGGISCGLRTVRTLEEERVFDIVQAVEIDLDAAATFSVNFPTAEVINGDLRRADVQSRLRACDVIVGGPPCQGFSPLGNGDPLGKYNNLWRAYSEVIARANPRYFVMENVPQFVRSPERKYFERELRAGLLSNYEVAEFSTLNCADFGVPQNRRRVIIVGTRTGEPPLGYPPLSKGGPIAVDAVFSDIEAAVTEIDLPVRHIDIGGKRRPGPFLSKELHLTRTYSPQSQERFRHIKPGGNRFDLPDSLQAPCWRNHTSGSTDVMGRLRLGEPSVTIRTEFFKPEKGRYLHPVEDRAITHFEASRLMGFPDDYLWVGSKLSIARQIGNAVPPPLAFSIGAELARVLGKKVSGIS